MVLRTKNAVLVVIGDIGRSPRMCYHAKSLADKNYFVQIVGYLDSEPHTAIRDHCNIKFLALRSVPKCIDALKEKNRKLSMMLKFLWVFCTLFFTMLFKVKWPLLIMMQNPPAVPAMFICWLAARLYRAQFIIDWHNYTYSMLCQNHCVNEADLHLHNASEHRFLGVQYDESSLGTTLHELKRRRSAKQERVPRVVGSSTGKRKRLINDRKTGYLIRRIIELIHCWEGFFGRRADLNLCVTHAMRQHMRDEWEVQSATVYDKPPSWKFKVLDVEQRHQLFLRLARSGGIFSSFGPINEDVELEGTRFSFRDTEGVAHLRPDRPLLVISSTSWTEDEDFGYLLDALRAYDNVAQLSSGTNPITRLPFIFCVITGKGPLKSFYLNRIEKAQMQNVTIITPWLEAEDYPLLLGSADIGVSLHTSTSGLDLPMKALDMFGCGLPVIAKRFPAVGELIINAHNGYLFDSSSELFNILRSLACGFPQYPTELKTLSSNVVKDHKISWDENWDACVWPLIRVFGALSFDELARLKRYAAVDDCHNASENSKQSLKTETTLKPTR